MSSSQMPTQQGVLPLPVSLHTLPSGAHVCQTYQTDDEREAVRASFVTEGATRNEQCLYVTATQHGAELSWAEHVQVFGAMEVWGENGRFHPHKARTWLQTKEQEAIQQGYSGVRLITDMNWCLPIAAHEASLVAYETQFESTTPHITILSQFALSDFPTQILLKLLLIHSYIGIGRHIYTNPLALPPTQLAAPLQQAWTVHQHRLEQIRNWIHKDIEREQRLLTETLTEATLALISRTNYDEVLEEILQQAERLVPYQSANIALVEGDTLQVARWRGYDLLGGESFIAHFAQPLKEKSISAEVITTGQPCVIDDTRQDDRWTLANDIEWVRSYLAVPISLRQQVIGVLRLSSTEVHAFTIHDGLRLQPLANVAAIAITNARLYQQAQQEIAERKQAEQALLESERRFAVATKTGKIGVWDWDLLNNKLRFESILSSLLGYEKGELTYDYATLMKVVYSDDLPHLQLVWQHYLSGNLQMVETILRLWHHDGSLRWGLLRGEPIHDENNRLVRLIGTITDITTTKQTETQLRRSEMRYRQIFEMNQAIKLLIDPDNGRIVEANRAASDFYGYSLQEFTQMSISDINTLSPNQIKQAMARARVKEQLFFDFRHRLASGEIRDVEVYSGPVHTDQGTLLYSIIHDVTERKQAEVRIQQLSQAVEQSPVSIVITDLQGNIEYTNPQFTAVTGYTKAEALGQNPRILKTGHTTPEEYETLWDTISSGNVWRGEFKNRAKDGSIYWEQAVISPIKNESGTITHFVAVKENITHIREISNALFQRNRELQLLIRAGQALNASLTLDHVHQTILEEIRHLLNVTACSVWLLDKDTGDLVCRQVTEPMDNVIRGWRLRPGQGIAGQSLLHRKSIIVPDAFQEELHYKTIDQKTKLRLRSILTVPLYTKQETIGVFQVVDEQVDRFTTNDLELMESLASIAANAIENAKLHENLQQQLLALQNTQQQLVQHEKLAAIGELAAGVAHELNNPLTSINLYVNLLQRRAITEETKHELDKIQQQTLQAASIVRSLLDFSRQHPPERTPTQVNDLVTGVIELLAYQLRSQKIEWQTQLQAELPLAQVDSRQILQVLVNLINNAIQAMQQNTGHRFLSVTTRAGASRFTGPATSVAEEYICISIEDNGMGISPDLQTRIFDPFFTTKPPGEGTGLGLSVCHGIISEHGGHIWVQSTPEQGSTFFIELPIVAPTIKREMDKEAVASEADAPDTIRPHILIIDDEEGIRAVLSRALRRENYRVDSVSDGETGLAYAQQHDYNIIVCDMHMPQIDGMAVYKQLQAQQPHLLSRLIFTTGETSSETVRLFLQETGASFLIKPFDLQDLRQMIKMKLNGSLAAS
ncbi:MAG: PAS domain S-box protein [Ardenticatenaceae bacterium]|nr:PAS domain S-box protein [Ardenticatenaceae bacterium]